MMNRMKKMCNTQSMRRMKHVRVYVVENEVNEVNEGCLMDGSDEKERTRERADRTLTLFRFTDFYIEPTL